MAIALALERLALTTGQAARVCGVDARTVRRWLDGTRDVPAPVLRLLWACERDPDLAPALLELDG